MTLSREEIAVRVLCALAQDPTFDASEGIPRAVRISDRLLAALTHPTVAPVAPPTSAFDVERAIRFAAANSPGWPLYPDALRVFIDDALACGRGEINEEDGYNLENRTAEVRASRPAAGLAVPPPAPTPAPEAKRPTRIRVLSDAYGLFTVGRVYDVIGWDDDVAGPRVLNDEGTRTVLVQSKWVPAPCPPPVAGSAEATRWRPSVEGCGKCQTSTWCCAARACLSESTPDGDRDVADRLALALAAKSGGA